VQESCNLRISNLSSAGVVPENQTTTLQRDDLRVNASNPDISEYVRRGGNRVQKTIGADTTRRALRLYIGPGMIECNGGPGTDTF